MKKTFFAACCSVLVVGFSIAQEAPVAVAPAAQVAETAEVVKAVAVPSAPAEDVTAAAAVAVQSETTAPVQDNNSVVVTDGTLSQGLVIGEGVPVAEGQMIESGPVELAPGYDAQGVFSQDVYSQGIVPQSFAPQSVLSQPVMSQSFAPQTTLPQSVVAPAAPSMVQPAPVSYNAPVSVADPFSVPTTTACVDCENNGRIVGRRGIVRSVTTRGRSMFTRVRGVFGRRR